MDDGWAWAEPIRERHFGPPLLGRFALERVTEGEYWSRWVPMWRRFWPPEVYFDFDQLCNEDDRTRRERVVESEGGSRLTENYCFYLFTLSVIAYGEKELGLDKKDVLQAVLLGAAAFGLHYFDILPDFTM